VFRSAGHENIGETNSAGHHSADQRARVAGCLFRDAPLDSLVRA